jgi:TolB-like protein
LASDDAMTLSFEQFELDPARFELRKAGAVVAAEPQVLSLLLLLASNSERMIGKDEIIEKIWGGRIVSEAAVASRVKSARQALGDDGTEQRLIRTVHGKGFRFVGEVKFRRPATSALGEVPTTPDHGGRPSIAVLPFRLAGAAGAQAFLADALSDELIADLARLRWLFVIARGSTFRFRGPEVDCRQAGEALGARYCLTGSLAFAGPAAVIAVELVDAASGEVLWAETFGEAAERVRELLPEIAARVVAALELQIPSHEAQIARGTPGALGAWSAYHIGLDHMFRFNRADNALAAGLFEQARQADPGFARAYGGLSFIHFQNAFLNYVPDRAGEAETARELASQALQCDRLDPFCHLNMGRSLWLCGELRDSIEWFGQATTISPSYAQGIYSMAWAKTLSGDADAGESDALLALRLSPLDPLRYAMLATCGLAKAMRGDYAEAAQWCERAARSPGAHKHIAVIAAIATSLAGQADSSALWIGRAKQSDPGLTAGDFLDSFPFAPTPARETIERCLAGLGL